MTPDSQNQEPAVMRFDLLQPAWKHVAAPRLGSLAAPGRALIPTPNFIALTSRGTVPHVTPDNVRKHLETKGAYVALEDFIERPLQNQKRSPPIFQTPLTTPPPPTSSTSPTTTTHPSRLHAFAALPQPVITILAPRRVNAVPSPAGNTNAAVSIFTSTGFQPLTPKDYLAAVRALQPDIAIAPADLTHAATTPPSKRALRMAERTDEWAVDWFADLADHPPAPGTTPVATFAPVLPIPYPIQWEYLSRLAEDYAGTPQLAGLAIHDASLLPDLAAHCMPLLPLPRLSLSAPPTPHHVLRELALGIDLFTLPFLNSVSDAGIALSFSIPPPPLPSGGGLLPLGIDMSSPVHATSVTPLSQSCTCYACASHHRAFVHHLLVAREMLGWTLLQIHNHAVAASFFAGVREALKQGGEKFEEVRAQFGRVYEPEFPKGLGERPRARGYQFKSVGGGEGKKNKATWQKFEGEGETDGQVEGDGQ
ncbi:tRNA-guanine(15) transglycosylase-like protein [Staphylotrichum tortipilum]|uniref:Queuine tRNA-ribosyltransferase accessory subunit 2 n=1 Tax=Staphylotrichum tortipilum TaxID=2831512 RepID=A0AAN6MMQ8_9PEZI|nr:tRNA-guanine(15) transglycosylase-like protein [Staphylotrichum longicolle]